jgi:hypothetical protein
MVFPQLSDSACPQCAGKPCRALAGSAGTSVVIAGARRVPRNCPVSIPASKSIAPFAARFQRYRLAEILALASEGSPSGAPRLPASTAPWEAARQLHAAGRIAVLAVAFGDPARKVLDEWRSATQASALKAAEEAVEEEAEAAKEARQPGLTNPVWVWLENPKMPGCGEKELESAAVLDAVWCKVDTQGMMPGDSVTFTVLLLGAGGGEDVKATTLAGRVGEGREDDAAVAKWTVEQSIGGRTVVPNKDKVKFIARVATHKLEATSAPLPIKPKAMPYVFSY